MDAITGALHALGALARWATRKKVTGEKGVTGDMCLNLYPVQPAAAVEPGLRGAGPAIASRRGSI